jgi:hypothetical protein
MLVEQMNSIQVMMVIAAPWVAIIICMIIARIATKDR